MFKLQVTEADKQEQDLLIFGMDLKLTLYFNNVANGWYFDLFDNQNQSQICLGEALTILSPALIAKGLPFVVTLIPKEKNYKKPTSKQELIYNFSIVFLSKQDFFAIL